MNTGKNTNEEDDEKDTEKEKFINEFGFSIIKPYSLKEYQKDAVRWMILREKKSELETYGIRGGLLADKMGLGKTLITTSLILSDKIYNKTVYPSLIVVPKSLRSTWTSEIEKFFGDVCPTLVFYKEDLGSKYDKITSDDLLSYKIIITTYETVRLVASKYNIQERQYIKDSNERTLGINLPVKPNINDAKKYTGPILLFKMPWQRVICDESQKFSNPKSLCFYSVMCLYGEKKWCLSATPFQNYINDIYSQLRFCGYNDSDSKKFTYNTFINLSLEKAMLSRNYEQAGVTLPQQYIHTTYLELEGNEKKLYQYYENYGRQLFKDFTLGKTDYHNILTAFLRCRQICICPYTILSESSRDSKEGDIEFLNKIKNKLGFNETEWLKDKMGTAGILSTKISNIVDTISSKIPKGEKVLVFTMFKKVIDIIAVALDEFCPDKKYLILDGDVTGKKREQVIQTFKKSDHEIFLITYQVGSVGLTLTEANHVIRCEGWWNPFVEDQAAGRSHRMGQTRETHVYDFLIKNSIEERIKEVGKMKIEMSKKILNGGNSGGGVSKNNSNNGLDARMIGQLLGELPIKK